MMGKKKQKKQEKQKEDQMAATAEIVEVVDINVTRKSKRQSAFSLYTKRSNSETDDKKKAKDIDPTPCKVNTKNLSDKGQRKQRNSYGFENKSLPIRGVQTRERTLSEDRRKEEKSATKHRSSSGTWEVMNLPPENITHKGEELKSTKRKQEKTEGKSTSSKKKMKTEHQNDEAACPSTPQPLEEANTKMGTPDLTPNSDKKQTNGEEMEQCEGMTAESTITCTKENLRPTSHFRSFELGKSGFAIVLLEHPGQLTTWGHARVRSLCGSVEVYGYHLTPDSAPVDMYSPNSSSFLALKTCAPKGLPQKKSICKAIKEISPECEDVSREILQGLNASSVLLLIGQIKEKQAPLNFLAMKNSQFTKVFPPYLKKGDQYDEGILKIGPFPFVAMTDSTHGSVMQFPPQMQEVAQRLSSAVTIDKDPIMVICGGKNMGKSSLCRFLMNSTRGQCSQVAYLECDMGQTEFTPPGCVGLHILEDPILGPPFTHQHLTARRMVYVGGLSPADDPQHYMRCLRYVHNAYTNLPTGCPLIVNTMGWNKGIGLSLLAETLAMVRPDIVVQLQDGSKYHNMPLVTPEFVIETQHWPSGSDEYDLESYTHELIVVQSAMNTVALRGCLKYSPENHRSLSLLGYLGRCDDRPGPAHPLQGLVPQTIAWGSLAVHVCNFRVPNSQVLYALNGAVVALCKVDENQILQSEDKSLPKFLSENPVCDCLGFGVVRAINPAKKVFHILTPLSLEGSTDVNCLLHGGLELPLSFVTHQPSVGGHIPYVDYLKTVLGSSSVKPRSHTFRRR